MLLRDSLVLMFGICGLAWYYFCLLHIGRKPLQAGENPTQLREFMSFSLTTIGTSLAAFVGMLLGLQSIAESAQAVQTASNTTQVQRLVEAAWTTQLQWIAGGLYLLSLIIALVFWFKKGDATDPSITNLGKSFIGLGGGALSILLNVPG